MDDFKRYGIYVIPEGAFYDRGAAWLGWDSVTARKPVQPDLSGLPRPADDLTATPRKYGFHGTIKPPFRLVEGTDMAGLAAATRDFCATRAPVMLPKLEVRRLGGFVAIAPAEPSDALADLAGASVAALDGFRAAPDATELAKRRRARLSDRQEALLVRWGYPYVMEEFRFHVTLTGKLPLAEAEAARDVLAAHFAPLLPEPYVINSLCLMGEDADGVFHLIHRYTLSG